MKQVKDVMTTNLRIIEPEATLESAATLMKEHDIGVLPVVTGEGRAVGTLTDRDLALRAVAMGHAPAETMVRDAMTPRIEFCYDDETVEELAQRMGAKKLRRLVVVDRDKKNIKGIVSIGDLAARGDSQMAAVVLKACVVA